MRLGLGRVGRVRAGWLPAYVVGTATAEVAQEAGVAGEQLRVELGLAVLAREEAAVVLQLADLAQMLAINRAPIVLDRVDQVVQLSLASQPIRDLKLAADDVLQVLLAVLRHDLPARHRPAALAACALQRRVRRGGHPDDLHDKQEAIKDVRAIGQHQAAQSDQAALRSDRGDGPTASTWAAGHEGGEAGEARGGPEWAAGPWYGSVSKPSAARRQYACAEDHIYIYMSKKSCLWYMKSNT